MTDRLYSQGPFGPQVDPVRPVVRRPVRPVVRRGRRDEWGEQSPTMELRPLDSWSMDGTDATFRNGTFHSVIAGVEIQKSDDDLARYQELVGISQPDILIETGTRAGGSALWFNRELGLQVISIDIAPQFTRGVPGWLGVAFFRGDSISADIVNRVIPMTHGKRVMVSLDSDHHSPHVQAEMAVWGQFVSPGCYLVIEDGCFDMFSRRGYPDRARIGGSKIPEIGGPLDAIEKSGIAHSSQWWRDEPLEGLTPISHSPAGWWRKHE